MDPQDRKDLRRRLIAAKERKKWGRWPADFVDEHGLGIDIGPEPRNLLSQSSRRDPVPCYACPWHEVLGSDQCLGYQAGQIQIKF